MLLMLPAASADLEMQPRTIVVEIVDVVFEESYVNRVRVLV